MPSSLRISLSFAASCLLIASIPQSLGQTPRQTSSLALNQAQNRIHGSIRESEVVTLAGNTHPLARAEFDQGRIDSDTRLERMVLLLQPGAAQQRRLDALTDAQQDPQSPLFRRWLSPEEFGGSFGASAQDAAQIVAWLESHGFSVEPIAAGRHSVVFSGTAAQVEETFHTQMHHYKVGGERHIANFEDPQIPKALAPVVAGILSLHDFRRNSEAHLVRGIADPKTAREEAAISDAQGANPENTQGSTHYLFPADFATIYDLNPLYNAGQNGSGISIAIVGRSNINLNDVASFRSYAGLAANAPTVILDGANPGLVAGDQDEATLDVEWSGGVAPNANIKYVVAKSTATSDGVDLAAEYIVNNKTALVMSTSFGSCEANMGATEVAFYNSLWQQAAAEGISAFVSSGDSGASGCDAGSATNGTGAAVNGLCTSPYSTCVGGTEFNEGNSNKYWGATNGAGGNSALSYIPEAVWNESKSAGGSGLWASGGGISQIYTQPSWQKSVAGANSNGMRAVPDVALNAASHDGYLVELNGSWYDFSGTSASSPSFAGIMALLIEKQKGTGQGNANPGLYAMLTGSANPFHATPSGNNSVPGVGGFTASGAAYNLATGLGSVDANVLVTNWQAAAKVASPSYAIKSSVGAISLLSGGKPASFTVFVSAAGGFTGQVSLTGSKLPSGVVVSFSPAVVKAGGASTATVTATNSATAGSGSLLLTGTSGSLQATSAVSLTVQMPATLTLASTAKIISVAQGKTATLVVTGTTGGIFTGPIKLSIPALPRGVTAAWSTSNFKLTGIATFTSTLTVTAASSAALTSGAINLTAGGDGLTATVSPTIQVTAAPAISMALTSAAISMKSSGSTQVVVKVQTAGGIKPAANLAGVTFQASGLPKGVSLAWSKTTQTAAGSLQATLTLTGSKKAVAGTARLTISVSVTDSVSKGKYTATAPASLTITAG